MTAAPTNEDDLGLNLVFTTPSIASDTTTAAGGGIIINNNKKPKRKTKYDKRRERGKLAKAAKDEEKRKRREQQQREGGGDGMYNNTKSTQLQEGRTNNTQLGDDDVVKDAVNGRERKVSSLVSIAAALSGSVNDTKKKAVDATTTIASTKSVAASETTAENQLSENENDIKTGTKVAGDGLGKEDDLQPKPKIESASSAVEPRESRLVESAQSSATQPTEGISSSSRRHRAQTFLSDDQHAAYLSEFHARPRDLDRTHHASKDIKVSCASTHIFGNDEGDDDVDIDDEENEDNSSDVNEDQKDTKKKSAAATASSTTTSCPFAKLGLHSNLVSTLTSPTGNFKLTQPTIVQSRSISALLPKQSFNKRGRNKSKNKQQQNLFIQSETGSGKTLAYLLPILQHLAVDTQTNSLKRIDRQLGGTRCILLCPTRELATQTYTFTSNLCTSSFSWIVPGCFSGGEKRKSEKARLRKGISILIATPGRLLDHLSKTESLLSSLRNKLEWLVLDEADRLLDAGLGGQVEQIIQHLRSNQPGAGPKRDGVTWRSVLVSATVNSDLESLAKTVLGGNGGWMWARGHSKSVDGKSSGQLNTGMKQLAENDSDDDSNESLGLASKREQANLSNGNNDNELDHSAPRQLAQLYMVVSAKLRLSSLVAFLSSRAAKGERTVVFMSTCDSVDYHYALFKAMESVLGNDTEDDAKDGTEKESCGIFGNTCPIYKLHGDIPHNKRQSTLKSFSDNHHSALLLATDVAARGLNFPSLDWIVQYDPPCETKDYVHRAGRSARAGQAGHALLLLLPSEKQYVEVLELRGMKEISALSLSSTLTSAAEICRGITQEGEAKAAGNTFSDGRGEAFTLAIQNRLEQCVLQNDIDYKASIEKKFKGDPKQRRKQKKAAIGPLLEGARKAFSAFVRAYPAKEKAVRHIFNARALHLGHIARSLALSETPKMVSKGNSHNNSNHHIIEGGKSKTRDKAQSRKGEKRNSRLAFGKPAAGDDDAIIHDEEQDRNLSLLGDAMSKKADGASSKKFKSSSSGGGKDVQKRMMEAAMAMQAQEFM